MAGTGICNYHYLLTYMTITMRCQQHDSNNCQKAYFPVLWLHYGCCCWCCCVTDTIYGQPFCWHVSLSMLQLLLCISLFCVLLLLRWFYTFDCDVRKHSQWNENNSPFFFYILSGEQWKLCFLYSYVFMSHFFAPSKFIAMKNRRNTTRIKTNIYKSHE